ncbi:MAG: hypothetical protein M3R71_05145, partial [Actinomycetota bacterium]|nr:hypothetical protein [Actinomycetota bacterium]
AFAPDAVRLLVEEAYRSNAGMVSPKVLDWDRAGRLQAVGVGADKVGAVHDMVDRGELDQEQHDAVRDVFVAPGCATLIRGDLFATLGGFDPEIDQFGEDLDLSWRAQIAGGRVVVAPDARVRHLEALNNGMRAGWTGPAATRRGKALAEQHRLRTLMICYGIGRLVWILPLAVIYLLGEAVTDLVRGQPGEAWGTLSALPRSLRRPGRLWHARRACQRHRALRDGEIRRVQSSGNARLRAFLRARVDGVLSSGLLIEDPESVAANATTGPVTSPPSPWRRSRLSAASVPAPESPARLIGTGSWRLPLGVAAALLVLGVLGSRSLWGQDLPVVGHLPVTSGGPGHWFQAWWSTWHGGGLGSTAPGAPALALLGVAGVVLLGAMGTLQHVLVLAPLVIGPFGAYRAARAWGSLRGRVAAMVVYATVPVAFDALARGHWDGLVVYAAAPWVLGALGRLSGEIPHPPTRTNRIGGRVLGLGVLVAVVAAFVPSFVFVVVVIGLALLAGGLLAGRPSSGLRVAAVALVASVLAVVLLAPWSGDVLLSRTTAFGVIPGPSGRLGLGQVLRFHTGPIGAGPLGWALLAAAALPLVIGRSWRLAWATRLWMVALACFGLTWGGLRGWFPVPAPEVLLAPAAAALAGAVALGVVAFELDLPGYRFGWRQLASGVAAVAAIVAAVPALTGVGGGRWHVPSKDATSAVAFLPDNHGGDYRVLWVG